MRFLRYAVLLIFYIVVNNNVLFGAEANPQAIQVGALLPLTGSLNSIGLSSKAAVELAVDDINIWLKRNQQNYVLQVAMEDTATNPGVALQGVQSLDQKGVRFVIGPIASSCVESVKTFVDSRDMLVLSPSSSSVSLSIPNDHIYRMFADDSNEGDAASYYCMKKGVTNIIPIYMDDSFGASLSSSTKKWVEQRGGVYDEGVKIDPNSSDYSADVASLKQKVAAALAIVPSVSVAVHVVAYDQTVDIMRLARQDAVLSQVRWIGCDGFTGNDRILNDSALCAFAQSVKLVSPVYQLDFDYLPYVENLMYRLREKLQRNPDAIALQTYDSVWLTFLAQRQLTEKNVNDCVSALESILPTYRGYTQVIRFNGNGDRYTGMYVFMDIKKKHKAYDWTKNSAFTFLTNDTGTNVLNRLLNQIPPNYPDEGSYTIPALCPLTGSLSQLGQSSHKTFALVQEDLQNFLELHNSTADITISVSDTQTTTSVALEQLKIIKANHPSPSFVVGPYSSEVLTGVKSFVDENDIILISPSSTSTSLSIPNDNLYRMTMDDAKQGFALAAYLQNEGIRAIIPVWLNNDYGNSLRSAFTKEFEAIQGIVLEGVSYAADETDFSSVLSELSIRLSGAQATYSNSEIGVLMISFDEGVNILALANGNADLSSVRWFGSDAISNSRAILDHPDASDFAARVRFTASAFAPELDLAAWKTAHGRLVKSYFENYLTRYWEKFGETPGSFAYSNYDSAWLATMVLFKTPSNASLSTIKEIMLQTMKFTNGYSELNRVNENGDKGYGTFGFASVIAEENAVSWSYKSAYHFAYEMDRDDWLEYYNPEDDPNTNVAVWDLY